MYGIHAYIDPPNPPTVCIYGIRGVSGNDHLNRCCLESWDADALHPPKTNQDDPSDVRRDDWHRGRADVSQVIEQTVMLQVGTVTRPVCDWHGLPSKRPGSGARGLDLWGGIYSSPECMGSVPTCRHSVLQGRITGLSRLIMLLGA